MNEVICPICKVQFNASLITHTCKPEDLAMMFLAEQEQPEAYLLNGDMLTRMHREIEDNGSPANLVAAWEKSAGRNF